MRQRQPWVPGGVPPEEKALISDFVVAAEGRYTADGAAAAAVFADLATPTVGKQHTRKHRRRQMQQEPDAHAGTQVVSANIDVVFRSLAEAEARSLTAPLSAQQSSAYGDEESDSSSCCSGPIEPWT